MEGVCLSHQRNMNAPPLVADTPRSNPGLYVRWECPLSVEDLEEIERRRKHYWTGTEIVVMEDAGQQHIAVRIERT